MPPIYDSSFKSEVLQCYQQWGPKEAALRFGVKQSIIQKWRRDAGLTKFGSKKSDEQSDSWKKRRRKRRQYDLVFKETVLEHFRCHGEAETCSKFQINANLIYKWRQKQSSGELSATNPFSENKKMIKSQADIAKENEILSFQQCSDEKKKEVVRYLSKHGTKEAMKKYKISNPSRLMNWCRKFRENFGDFLQKDRRKISKKEAAFRQEVLAESEVLGIKATSEKFNVSIKKIRYWKSKVKKDEVKSESFKTDIDDIIKLEPTEDMEEDTEYNPISLTDMLEVDQQLRNQTPQKLGDNPNDLVKIKDEVFLNVDMKIEVSEHSIFSSE